MRPQYTVLTSPAAEPISTQQACDHLRIDSNDDISYVSSLIPVAREYFDSMTGRSSALLQYQLTASNWQDIFDQTPTDRIKSSPRDKYAILLFRSPLVSVDSVKYYAPGATALTTMSASNYRVVTTAQPGILQLIIDPPDIDDRVDAIQITFTAGTDCPSAMAKHAIRMLTANFYEQRTPVAFTSVAEIPFTLRAIIDNQRIRGHFA
jgi:uncharacterized phiE125 gp8 family phage protein